MDILLFEFKAVLKNLPPPIVNHPLDVVLLNHFKNAITFLPEFDYLIVNCSDRVFISLKLVALRE